MTAPTAQLSVDEILAGALHAWTVAGEDARALAWSELLQGLSGERQPADTTHARAAVIPALHTVECIFDRLEAVQVARTTMSELVSSGWLVNVLLPVALLGEAHDVFRGLQMKLHGAWGSDAGVFFTAPQTP